MRIEGHKKADLENVAHVNATIGGNPRLAHPILQALEAAGDDPGRLAKIINAGLEAGKNKLPEVPAPSEAKPSVSTPTKRGQFSELYAGEHCKLEARSTRLGREVRLTLNAGSTLEKAFDEINAKSQEKFNRDAIYRGTLYKDSRVTDVLKETTVITFTPVIKEFGSDPETSHEALLKKHGMDWVDRPYQTAAAGAFRIAKGFKEGVVIGSTDDKGDLFNGLVARSRSGAVGTDDRYGVYADGRLDADRYGSLVVSGRSSSN
jgi:hypothetical protein